MIYITKAEADFIRSRSKKVKIVTTGKNKNSRQKKRYADETSDAFRLLRKFHSQKK